MTHPRIAGAYPAPPELFRDRVVLVTGAGSGIGRAVATGLGAAGATVVLLGRTVRKLESTYDTIVTAGGPTPAIFPMNLATATESDCDTLATGIRSDLGGLDGVAHLAAAPPVLSPIDHASPNHWAATLQVNLTAPFLITRACLPLMRAAPRAVVVFTSDDVGRTGRAYWGAYSVSKFGLEGLAQVLRDELEATSIRVHVLNPGPVRTAHRVRAYPAEDHRRLPEPEAVAGAYLHLLGPDGDSIPGCSLDVVPDVPEQPPAVTES